jgi:hypothetical protein
MSDLTPTFVLWALTVMLAACAVAACLAIMEGMT